MKSSDLAQKLAPFSSLVNKHALSPTYRALRLTPTSVRGCSAFGVMEAEVATGLESEVHVDGDMFLQLLRSLPAADLDLTLGDSSLQWRCGAARGKFAVLGEKVDIPAPPWPAKVKTQEVDKEFGSALELGMLACGSPALLSVGLYGTSIIMGESLVAYSSDNTTIAKARLSGAPRRLPGVKVPEVVTLSPDSARLVVALGTRQLAWAVDEQSVYVETPDTRCVVKQVPPLKFDLREHMAPFLEGETRVPLDRDVIAAFVRRAEGMAEERGRAAVTLGVREGAVRLAFEEGKASSEEYYLAESAPKIEVEPISVEARRIAKALTHSSHIVFDHAARGALVLHGDREFVFVVSGRGADKK
jgi:hypothetical protein